MVFASLSDLHLGYSGPGRTQNGRNVRQMDVERAWAAAVDAIIDRKPDLVTIAGDCFHSVRPSFHAVRAFQMGIERLTDEGIRVVIIGGNHESPRTRETLTPNIVAEGNAYVVTRPCRRLFSFRFETVNVACLPFVALDEERTYQVEPDPSADINMLLIHAAVQTSAVDGALPKVYGGAAAYDVGREAEKWDVIACGDYHEFTRLHPSRMAFYSGSIERTSSNIWDETAPKGFVLGDTASGEMEFVEIPTREMVDYEYHDFATYGEPVNVDALNEALRDLTESDGIADALVRLKVEGFPRGERDAIDWKRVAQLKEKCTHFLLDLRYAERDVRDLGDRRERAGRTLRDEASDFFAEDEQPVREAAFTHMGMLQEVAGAA
jgi:DNA repair exonuclease SbcCD nuclease subunit